MMRSLLLLSCTAVMACSPAASKQYLVPYIPPNRVVDANAEVFDPKADILFVVDNSGSMDAHQRNLANNISLFTKVFLQNSILDYNIGVVSSDTSGLRQPCCGRLVGSVRVVNKMTPNADTILANNLKLGTGGDGYEKAFDPVYMALGQDLRNTWNAGFLRDDATLIVIFITDAEDQSERVDAKGLHDFLLELKNGDSRKVLGFGAVVPSGVTTCPRDPSNNGGPAPEPKRIEEFLSMTDPNRTNILNLCATDYGTRLAQFATDIVNQVSSVVYLSRAPVMSSIRVTYGSADLPMDAETGWSFDPSVNAIRLGPKIDWSSQPNGSRVKVFYDAARFDEE